MREEEEEMEEIVDFEEIDHKSIISVFHFIQNLFFYCSSSISTYTFIHLIQYFILKLIKSYLQYYLF